MATGWGSSCIGDLPAVTGMAGFVAERAGSFKGHLLAFGQAISRARCLAGRHPASQWSLRRAELRQHLLRCHRDLQDAAAHLPRIQWDCHQAGKLSLASFHLVFLWGVCISHLS